MASEISHRHTATGETLYATIRNTARQMWNTAGTPAFEALTVANWTDYDIALSETPASSYFYVGTFPAVSGNMVAGWYWVDVFKRAGGSSAIGDTLLASYFGYWDGTTFKWWADDTTHVGGTLQTARDIGTSVLLSSGTGTGQVSLDSGKVTPTDASKTGYALSATGLDAVLKMKALLDGTPSGSVVDDDDPDPSTTAFETDLAEASNDHYNGAFVVFYSGALAGQSRKISDYDGTTKVLTVAVAFTEAPAAGDDFLIIGRSE
jgi:hypothetical protein